MGIIFSPGEFSHVTQNVFTIPPENFPPTKEVFEKNGFNPRNNVRWVQNSQLIPQFPGSLVPKKGQVSPFWVNGNQMAEV